MVGWNVHYFIWWYICDVDLAKCVVVIGSSESQLTENPSWYIQEAG